MESEGDIKFLAGLYENEPKLFNSLSQMAVIFKNIQPHLDLVLNNLVYFYNDTWSNNRGNKHLKGAYLNLLLNWIWEHPFYLDIWWELWRLDD